MRRTETKRFRTKKKNEFGRRREALASKWTDGAWHVAFRDEPDLTYVFSENDFRKTFEEVK